MRKHRRKHGSDELGAWYSEFVAAIPTSPAIGDSLRRASAARTRWRFEWERRGEIGETTDLFLMLFPTSDSTRQPQSDTHPVRDDAAELEPWLRRCLKDGGGEARRIARTVVELVSAVESGGDNADAGIEFAGRGLVEVPLAAVTPLLSHLSPDRYVPLCRRWLRVLGYRGVRQLPEDLGSYASLNEMALAWLAEVERGFVSAVATEHPAADRLTSFLAWAAREKRADLDRASFAVSRERYEDWPPMW